MEQSRAETLTSNVLAYVTAQSVPVRPDEVAEQLGVQTIRANWALCRLATLGDITRVRRGLYSGDPELRRRALLHELNRLAKATSSAQVSISGS